jgi:hypothetical protein
MPTQPTRRERIRATLADRLVPAGASVSEAGPELLN